MVPKFFVAYKTQNYAESFELIGREPATKQNDTYLLALGYETH